MVTSRLTWQEYKQILAVCFTQINTMMGVALLTLSFTLARTGLIASLILLTAEMLFSLWGFFCIISLTHHLQLFTNREIHQKLFGRVIAYTIDSCIVLEYIGYLIAYFSVVGDYIFAFIKNVSGGKEFDVRFIKLIFAPVLFAISCSDSLRILSQLSAISFLFIIATVITIFVLFGKGVSDGVVEQQVGDSLTIVTRPLQSINTLLMPIQKSGAEGFAEFILRTPLLMPLFGLQMSLPIMYRDVVGQANMKKRIMDLATLLSTLVAFVLYLATSVCSYFLFGRHIQGNVLLSFPASQIAMTVIRLLYSITIVLSYAVIVYPIRAVIMDWMRIGPGHRRYKLAFILIALVLDIVSAGLSIAIPSIVTILNFAASFFGIGIYFLEPLLAIWYVPYVKAHSRAPKVDDEQLVSKDRHSLQQQTFIEIARRMSMHLERTAPVRHMEQKIVSRGELIQEQMGRNKVHSMVKMPPPRTSSEMQMVTKARAGSVAISAPSQPNDLFKDTFQAHDSGGRRSHNLMVVSLVEGEGNSDVQDQHPANQELAVAVEHPAIVESPEAGEQCNSIPGETALPEERDRLLKKMNRCRKGTIYFFIILSVVYNLVSFALLFVNLDGDLRIVPYK